MGPNFFSWDGMGPNLCGMGAPGPVPALCQDRDGTRSWWDGSSHPGPTASLEENHTANSNTCEFKTSIESKSTKYAQNMQKKQQTESSSFSVVIDNVEK